jgi:hypothetical protein
MVTSNGLVLRVVVLGPNLSRAPAALYWVATDRNFWRVVVGTDGKNRMTRSGYAAVTPLLVAYPLGKTVTFSESVLADAVPVGKEKSVAVSATTLAKRRAFLETTFTFCMLS